jgi:hypothetical protein
MSDDGHFRFASFGGVRDGRLLLFEKPVEEKAEDLGEVVGAMTGVIAVRKTTKLAL